MKRHHLSRELFKSIRGKRSQNFVNQKLQYSFNQVYRWESGLTYLHWSDFVKLCKVCKSPLKDVAKGVLHYNGNVSRVDQMIVHLIGQTKLSEAAALFEVSRFVLSDWIKAKSEPNLDQILIFLEKKQLILPFLDGLGGANATAALQEVLALQRLRIDIFTNRIDAFAAGLCFELEDYLSFPRHVPGHVANKLGISLKEEEELIDLLKQAQMIIYKNDKYISQLGIIEIGLSQKRKEIIRSLLKATLSKMDRQVEDETDVLRFRLFSVSEKAHEEIQKELSTFYNKMISIISEDKEPARRISVLNVQFFDYKAISDG